EPSLQIDVVRMTRLAPLQGIGGMTGIAGIGWNPEVQGSRAANADAGERPLIDFVGDIFPDVEPSCHALWWEPRPILPAELVGQSAEWDGEHDTNDPGSED